MLRPSLVILSLVSIVFLLVLRGGWLVTWVDDEPALLASYCDTLPGQRRQTG